MATHDQFDGFSIYLAEDEDGDFIAHFVELPNVSAFANTPEEAIHELKIAWEGVKQSGYQQKVGQAWKITLVNLI